MMTSRSSLFALGYIVLIAGLIAMLIAYKLSIIREWFLAKDIREHIVNKKYRIYFDKYFQYLRFLLYLAICLAFANHDIFAIYRILFNI